MKNKKTFIIAEAGSNWRMGTYGRDIKMAKALIDVAAESGADAIKFQTYRPETVYVPNAGNADYLSESGIKESVSDIFKDLSMPYEMIPVLAEYCDKKNIQFMSTPFSIDDAKAIDPYVKIHKIASYEISHPHLIKFAAKSGKPLILSTGGATLDDIEWALDYYRKNNGKEISLLQTTAKYPAPLSTLNLYVIPNLMKKFGVPVGFSDHSRDPIIGPVTAVALGATIIEKHFTLHNALPGPDHSFALTPQELRIMVKAIRDCESCLGSGEKTVQAEEKKIRDFAQRAIQAIKPIKTGEILKQGLNVDVLRPGKQRHGLHPKNLPEIEGKKSTRDIPLGDGIRNEDFK